MPSVLISNEGGVTRVAPIQATPEMLTDAVEFAGPEQAVTAAMEVLGEGAAPPEGAPADPAADPAQDPAQQGGGEIDALMEQGFQNAKRGRA